MSEKTYGKEGVSFPVKGSGKWIAGKYVKYRNLEISAVWQKSGRVVKGTGKMRKAQKRQIEEFTTLLEQAHKEISMGNLNGDRKGRQAMCIKGCTGC